MEKNANLHRETEASSLCATISADMEDVTAVSGMKGTADKRKNTEPCLSTLVNVSCNNSTATVPGAVTVIPNAEKSDVRDMVETLPVHEKDTEATGFRESGDTISNGMGHDSVLATGNSEGGTSKLVNNKNDGLSSPPSGASGARNTDADAEIKQAKLAKPTHLCPGNTITGNVKSGLSGDRTISEGLPSGSDPDPSLAGESRSLDSLESFSNLNSCPSSDLNSDGSGDRGLGGLALALHGEDGNKILCAKDRVAGQSIYHIKWIKWKDENTPIITQNENGPCPLLAIMNVLLLAWKVKMPPMMEIITAEQLMEYLGDYILDTKPKEISEAQRLNYEQNMSDAMAVLHKLQTGLDVNVKFTGVRVFEYTPECIVFDLLDIPLYHGWLVDPQMCDIVKAVGNCSYNQLVEKIISCKQSDSSELAGEGIVAEQFLSSTATQLTYHGLCELTSTVQEGELCVFFRNNHFSTMIKYKGQLYLLVTDQGFLTEEKVVWESLHNVDGDGNFCDSEFRLRPPSDPETVYRGQQDQIDQDYLMALSLQEQQSQDLQWEQLPEGISDLELAKKLQEEEDRRASQYYQEQEQEQAAAAAAAAAAAQAQQGQQEPAQGDEADRGVMGAAGAAAGTGAAAGATPSPGKQSSSGERKPKKESKEKDKCVIL
ncbi:ubiquitin carboxyl-terminal hydrolase MINDY-2 [Diretmus argenteus]